MLQGSIGGYMLRILSVAYALLFSISSVQAQEKAGIRDGFEAADIRGEKIILFRPDIQVGEQSMGGMFEPRAEWTTEARRLIDAELEKAQARLTNQIVQLPELYGDDADLLAEHQALFETVSDAIVEYQFFVGNRLPTQKKGSFDWTLGTGTARLAELSGANYGLFIVTEDHYGSTGRKILQFAAAGLFGAGVQSGIHKGAAGLIDLRTGNIVWLNADLQMGGDVRNSDGVEKRVGQLLEDFHGSVDEGE